MSKITKVILIIFAILLVFLVAMGIFAKSGIQLLKPQSQEQSLESDDQKLIVTEKIASCGTSQELFTALPLQLDDFAGIVPLGNLAPTSHIYPTSHLYFHIRRSNPKNFDSLPLEVPLVAPANMTIVRMKGIEVLNKPQYADYADYYLEFYPCQEFRAYFDHVKSFSPKLKQAYDKGVVGPRRGCVEYAKHYQREGELQFRLCEKSVEVQVEAGETLGTAGGGQGQAVFDFGAFDRRITKHVYANPSRWQQDRGGDLFYVVCGLDYFAAPFKEQFKAKLGQSDGSFKRTKEPVCGQVAQDVTGAAQGVWFLKGTTDTSHERGVVEDYHLSLVPDNVYSDLDVFAIGLSMEKSGLNFGTYSFTPQHSGTLNRAFREVQADANIYCYETIDRNQRKTNFRILLQMPSKESLKLERQDGSCSSSGSLQFTDKFTEFER